MGYKYEDLYGWQEKGHINHGFSNISSGFSDSLSRTDITSIIFGRYCERSVEEEEEDEEEEEGS